MTSTTPDATPRALNVRQAAFIGVGAMVGAGIFALLGAAGEVAGAAVWLSFLIAGPSPACRGTRSPSSARYFRRGLLEYVVRGSATATSRHRGCPSANALITGMVAVSFGSYASEAVADGSTAWVKVSPWPSSW